MLSIQDREFKGRPLRVLQLLTRSFRSLKKYSLRARHLRKLSSQKHCAFQTWKAESSSEAFKIMASGTRDLKSDLREIVKTQREIRRFTSEIEEDILTINSHVQRDIESALRADVSVLANTLQQIFWLRKKQAFMGLIQSRKLVADRSAVNQTLLLKIRQNGHKILKMVEQQNFLQIESDLLEIKLGDLTVDMQRLRLDYDRLVGMRYEIEVCEKNLRAEKTRNGSLKRKIANAHK